MQALSVHLLGGFAVDGIERQAFGSRKARRLAELLALGRGRVVPTAALLHDLWGERPPARPADQLAVLVSRLRSLLGSDGVQRRDGGYLLHYDRLDVDEVAALTDEVERRLAAGEHAGAVLSAARSLLVPLSGTPPESGESSWVLDRVAAIDRMRTRARHAAAAALLAGGRWADAADAAASCLDQDPYDETAVRVFMTARASAGRVGSALAGYATLRERLAEDLGADPSAPTQALHAAILRGEISQLPATDDPDAGPLFGRGAELSALDAAADLAGLGSTRVVIVEGEAGIGKTSLLRTFAARRAAAGDLVVPATCGPLDQAVPLDAVLVALADHLRGVGDEAVDTLLGADRDTLGPLFGLAPVQVGRPLLADGVGGPAVLFAMVFGLLARAAAASLVVLIVDDAHLGGPILTGFIDYLSRRAIRLLVVAAVRSGEGGGLSGHERLDLGPLDRAAASALVGADRVADLYPRTDGHPLLLVELAAATGSTTGSAPGSAVLDPGAIPASLVDAVSRQCDALGDRGASALRAAAVLGPQIDIDLLSGVLHRPVVDVLDDLDKAMARRLVVETAGALGFRHDLVRQAIAAGTSQTRTASLHREAGRLLARRSGVDPILVADHARIGADGPFAARWYQAAAVHAGERFDHQTAEALLDEAVRLDDGPQARLARARVRTLRGRYADAVRDVDRSGQSGAPAQEVRAWASYFDRRFDVARDCAEAGAAVADDPVLRARCLMVGGRTRHAVGHLGPAEALLIEAMTLATGSDRVAAGAWLGVIRAHQSRLPEALALLGPALRTHGGAAHTAAELHALLFSGHAHALAGRPDAALAAFHTYTAEVQRRQVPRFAGRGINFGGWVLRNIGALGRGVDAHLESLEIADRDGTPEVRIAALLDLAESAVLAGDVDTARTRLAAATGSLAGDLVFGWRLEFKAQLIRGRLALAAGEADIAVAQADTLALAAGRIGVPRYSSVARLLGHRARIDLGQPVDPALVERDLDLADRSVAIESWWWAGDLGAALHVRALVDRAERRAARLIGESGVRSTGFDRFARARIDTWRAKL